MSSYTPAQRGRLPTLLTGVALLLGSALPASAQVAWDAPLLVAPQSATGLGIYLVDPAPGSGIGVMGSWRTSSTLGFRVGIAEGHDDDLALYGGVDFSGALLRAGSDQPIDIDWVAGAGLGAGESILLSFPLGLTVGTILRADGVSFGPYLTPRVVLDAWFGDDGPSDNLDLNLAVDLGVDIAFSPGWMIRFGGTIGDREALAIGVLIR